MSASGDIFGNFFIWTYVALLGLVLPVGILAISWLFMTHNLGLVITTFVAINLFTFGGFGRLMADPRGGWSMWWHRERTQYDNTRTEVALLMLVIAAFWAMFGILLLLHAVTGRHGLRERLDREDARWRETVNGSA